ncbi:MAG: hypothetical protein R3F65_15550 [bacterium]
MAASHGRCALYAGDDHPRRRERRRADFVEFPAHPKLAGFDRSDRKFVATAAGHAAPHPPIVQAADSKWVGWAPALAEVGIAVEFVCRGDIQKTYGRRRRREGDGSAASMPSRRPAI